MPGIFPLSFGHWAENHLSQYHKKAKKRKKKKKIDIRKITFGALTNGFSIIWARKRTLQRYIYEVRVTTLYAHGKRDRLMQYFFTLKSIALVCCLAKSNACAFWWRHVKLCRFFLCCYCGSRAIAANINNGTNESCCTFTNWLCVSLLLSFRNWMTSRCVMHLASHNVRVGYGVSKPYED